MPVRMGSKKYKTFGRAVSAVRKKKGLSKKRASAYVATVERIIKKRHNAKHRTRTKRR